MGADHIRLPIDYVLLETEEGAYKEDSFYFIDKAIEWCGKYSLNLILDLHKTAGYTFENPESSAAFFVNKQLQGRFIKLWSRLAQRYGQYHNRVAFELLNEIVLLEVADKWNAISKAAIEEIRKSAPETYIIIGGVCYNSLYSIRFLEAPFDDRIVYTFHCYDPKLFTHQGARWMKQFPTFYRINYPGNLEQYREDTDKILGEDDSRSLSDKSLAGLGLEYFEYMFQEAIALAESRNVPLYCGEYGVINNADITSKLNWYKDIHAAFEKYDIGRAVWTYKKMDFGIIDKHNSAILKNLIELL